MGRRVWDVGAIGFERRGSWLLAVNIFRSQISVVHFPLGGRRGALKLTFATHDIHARRVAGKSVTGVSGISRV